jgi:hypothetical protein
MNSIGSAHAALPASMTILVVSTPDRMLFIIGMYGPPQDCKRKTEKDKLVCANVFGLWWSQRLLAMMDSARSLPY